MSTSPKRQTLKVSRNIHKYMSNAEAIYDFTDNINFCSIGIMRTFKTLYSQKEFRLREVFLGYELAFSIQTQIL